jgi:hypothetical protein
VQMLLFGFCFSRCYGKNFCIYHHFDTCM